MTTTDATAATPAKYTRTAMALHWVIALLISINLVLIWFINYWPEERVRLVIDTHKSIGITVLGLAIVRLLWRYSHKPPALPSTYKRWEQRASHWAHMALYGVMLLLPISGWLHDSAWKDAATHPMQLFGLVPWPRIGWIMNIEPATKEMLHDAFGLLHTVAAYLLYVLWVAHVGGALKHQFVDKDPELQRMLP
ncbi:MAG: cytochrome b [Pseudomonadota bacterium]